MFAIRSLALLPLALMLAAAPTGAGGKPGRDREDTQEPKKRDKRPQAAPAVIKVYIPADAKLTIDGFETTQATGERLFATPPLAPGWRYTYLLKATWEEDKRPIIRMAVVSVRAGKQTVVDLRPGSKDASSSQILYVPTPQKVVDRMLQMAKVTKNDIVFDLGCGDGRVVVTAAKRYGARGVGVDIDPERVKDSLENVRKEKVGKLVEIRQGDALMVPDLARATVVVTYMLPEFMEKLRPILRKQLKPGTRIVAHDYAVPNWEPQDSVTIKGDRFFTHTLYLWRVPPPETE